MLATLRRIYLYAVASAALLFLVGVLQNFLYQLSVQAGVRHSLYDSSSATDFSRALVFVLVAAAIVLPVGVLHWWFIRRDARTDPTANSGVVRVIFLDLLTVLVGTVTVFAAAYLAYALLFDTSANYGGYYDYYSNDAPSIAGPLSVTLAWGAALMGLLLERRATLPLKGAARGISMVLGYLQQIELLIAVMVAGSRVVQEVLDITIHALPACGTTDNLADFNANCQPSPYTSVGGDAGILAVLVVSLIGFTLWTRRDGGSVYRQLADSVFLIVATITAVVGLASLANLVLSLAAGQASWPLALIDRYNVRAYSFLGQLLFGGGAMAFYLVRAWRTPATGPHPQQTHQVAVVGVALPLAFTFLTGVWAVLYVLFRSLQGHVDAQRDWLDAWSILIAGAAWLALWPTLARMSDPRGTGPLIPRRTYVYILFASALIGGIISLAVGVYLTVTTAIGAVVDTTGRSTAQAYAIVLVSAATAGYYFYVLQRDGRILRERAPATPVVPPATPDAVEPATPASLESVLTSVAGGQMAVPQAAAILREQFGAR